MATRHEITSIQFKADAGEANAAIDSIRQKAKEANDQMTQLRQKLEEGRKANLPIEDLKKMEDQLKSATKEAKQWGDAQRNLMRGVKALDEAIIQFNRGQGSVEKMSAALSKAARNAAQLQQSRMERGSQGWQEMEALITALDKNLIKARQDFDSLVQTIEAGGRVSVSELTSAKQSLKELSDLTAYGSDEWKGYQAQLDAVTKRFDSLSQTEKRLAGEIVTVEDARKRAAAADADEARWREILAQQSKQQATADRERAEGALQIAKTNTAWIEQDIAKTKEQLAAQQQLVGSIEALEDAESQAMSKTMAAETALQKQREETNKFSDATWEAAKKVGELEAKLKELDAQPVKPKVDTSETHTNQQTQATADSTSTDQQKLELQQQLADAQQKLNEAKTAAEGPTKKLQEAEAAYTEAEKKEQEATEALAKAKGNMNLSEEEDKLDALERKHDDLTESLQKQKQAEQELAQNAADTRQKEQEAAIELAQAQNQSEESLKKSVEVLEQQNKTLEAGSAEWQENEQAIGKLNKRIEELKQQSQELRGEVMSLAEAEELADKAMEEQALTTKTGWAASTEELKRAEQTLADKVAKAKRGTAEEEAAYQKLVRQLQAVRTELGAGSMSGKQMMDVLSDPKNVTSVDTLKAAIGRARQELDALGRRIDQARMDGHTKEAEELAEAYDDIAEGAKNADQRMKELQAQSKGTASAFDKAWSRLKTYVGLYVGAAVAMQKLSQAMGDLLTLSDKMGEVRKTTGFTADEVGRLSNNLAKLDTRTTLTQLMELSSLAGSVGLKTQEQVEGFTEAANQLIVALPELGNESARTIIKIANATGDLEKNGGNVRETLEKVGSTIIALRANSASAAGPITDFVSRVGAVGAQAGISIDQIAALGSTIDALGGRVEMSATALSRMIPAIKNNSFAIANSIGVTEKYLKSLAPMEQMVLIFQKMRDNIAHIDTTTEAGQEQMAATIEGMLGKNATMREVMKDLEQQGARAGIVFGLLSQNVDELQKQLGIASEAYEKNTALANEFANMNETTAAKWERLKNQVEEFFVEDKAQRRLGWIIDRLRELVDWIAEDGPIVKGLKIIAVYAAAMKMELGASIASAGGAFKNLGIAIGAGINQLGIFTRATAGARDEWKKMDATMKANIWGAVIAAIGAIAYKLWDMHQAAKEAAAEIGRFNQKVADEKKALGDLFTPLQKSNIAQDERSKLISEINSKYSRYLGFMLSETNSAIQLADAHALIAKRIREEAYEKRILEQEDKVRNKHNEDVNAAYGNIEEQVRKGRRGNADVSEVSDILKSVIDRNLGNVSGVKNAGDLGDNRYVELSAAAREDLNNTIEALVRNGKIYRQNATLITGAVMKYAIEAKEQYEDMQNATASTRADLRNVQRSIRGDINANLNDLVKNIKDFGKPQTPAPVATPSPLQKNPVQMWEERMSDMGSLNWQGNSGTQANVQVLLPSDRPQIDKKNIEQVKQYVEYQDQLRGYLQANAGQIDEQTRKTAEMYLESEEEMKKLRALLPKDTGAGTGSGGGGTNPYGSYNRVTSPYQDWDADALVARRKEMLERVRALANGAKVQSVLDQDAKFITEATRKNIKDTKQAIEWYNTERLKIQDALHEKHLTNTGDWMDPKKGGAARALRAAEKAAKEEMRAALDALDAYYNERDARIKEAQNQGEITEEESKRRTLQNDLEHYKRREELRRMFLRDTKNISQEEQDAIMGIIDYEGDGLEMTRKLFTKTVDFIDQMSKRGSSLRDGIRKNLTQDMRLQQQVIEKFQKNLNAILKKGFDAADKAYDQFKQTLDALGVMVGTDGLSTNMETFLSNTSRLAEHAREAWRYRDGDDFFQQMMKESQRTLETLGHRQEEAGMAVSDAEFKRLAALMKAEQAYYDWLVSTDKKSRDAMLLTLKEFGNNYESAIQKLAKQQATDFGKRFAYSDEGRAYNAGISDQQTWADIRSGAYDALVRAKGKSKSKGTVVYSGASSTSTETTKSGKVTTKTKTTVTDPDNRVNRQGTLSGTGVFGSMAEKKADLELLDLRIEKMQAGMKFNYELMTAEEARLQLQIETAKAAVTAAEAEAAAAEEGSLAYTEAMAKRMEAVKQQNEAEQQLATQQAVNQQMMADQSTALDQLYADRFAKTQEINSTLMEGIEGYITSLDAFAERAGTLIGEGAFGDPAKRKEAGQELAKDVIKTTGNLLKQWMVYMTTRKFMDEAEVKMHEAKNIRILAADAMLTGQMLTIHGAEMTGAMAMNEAEAISKEAAKKGLIGLAIGAAISLALTALMSMAMSKMTKAKSEVASIAGVSASAGRLTTGMLTYAEGNVNEFTDPSSLTPGKQYNVDAADGRTYRARYMGRNPKTHLTNGPEFHLSGERGREMIIDAGTTRQITMNESEIWHAIQTLSGGGRISAMRRRGRGVAAFAEGNVSEFSDYSEYSENAAAGMSAEQAASLQASIDRQSDLLEDLRINGIKATFDVYGKGGLVDSYDSGKKTLNRYGQRY